MSLSSDPGHPLRCSPCGAPPRSSLLKNISPACLLLDVPSAPTDQRPSEEIPGGAARKPASAVGGFFIPGHEVLEEIAAGGMGVVYRARQLEPPREVALKMLLPTQMRSAELRERFRIEARAAAALDHAAILPLYELGEHDG